MHGLPPSRQAQAHIRSQRKRPAPIEANLPRQPPAHPQPQPHHAIPRAPAAPPPIPANMESLVNETVPMIAMPAPADGDVWDWPVGAFYIKENDRGELYASLMLPAQPGVDKSYAVIRLYMAGTPKPGSEGDPKYLRAHSWSWDGNREKPTFQPSIRHADNTSDHYWHGFVTAGVMVGCKNEMRPKR